MPITKRFHTVYSSTFSTLFNNLSITMGEHGYLRGDETWNINPPPIPYNRLYYIVDGYGFVEENGKKTELLPGNIYLLTSQKNYHMYAPEYLEKFYIHFNATMHNSHDIFLFAKESVLQLPWNNRESISFADMVNYSEANKLLPYRRYIHDTIFDFLNYIPSKTLDQIFEHTIKYQDVFTYIEYNLRISLTTEEIVRATGISDYVLLKKFKQNFGFTLNEYIRNKLLNYAITQLTTKKTIKEIAGQLDFCDEYYFSNWFKKITGYSPSVYRKGIADTHSMYFYKDHLPFRGLKI